MIHRHLDYPADTPVEEVPSAAIVDILDRGDLQDWAPILRAVAADPHGAFADRVARIVDAFPMYGTSTLWRNWIELRRARAAGPIPQPARRLADIRAAQGLTQVEVADRMGISQSDVSKIERRTDVRVGTLARYARALGGRLRLAIGFDEQSVGVRLGDPHDG